MPPFGGAVIRPGEIVPVDQRHDRTVLLADLGRPKSAISPTTDTAVIPAAPSPCARPAHAAPPGSFAELSCQKSFSTFSWPICRYRRSTDRSEEHTSELQSQFH